ncbi:MAG: hypothetical protein U9N30_04660 [Campylobacterota bacterium]|nr:hypothetical protein [Campylobacterota bacterium]
MRLTYHEIKSIIEVKNTVYDDTAQIYLFGSRIDDTKKGGDIDLYLIANTSKRTLENKLQFQTLLISKIGDQKIDLIYHKDSSQLIEQEALKNSIELNLLDIKLLKYLNECDKHLQRINEAYEDMQTFLPINAKSYQNLNKNQVQDIDQYLFRFSKLQDILGEKIFKLILDKYSPSNNSLSFIDILNTLEKLDFLTNAQEWQRLRKIRDDIAHQYDDEPEESAQAINNIASQKEILETIYIRIKNKLI